MQVSQFAVLLQRSERHPYVVGFDCFEQPFVTPDPIHRIGDSSFFPQISSHGQLQLQQDRRVCQIQLTAAGERHDGLVEATMGVVLSQRVPSGIGLAHLVESRAYRSEHLEGRRSAGQSASDRVTLEDLTQLEQLEYVFRRPHGHPKPAARKVFDETLLSQQP